MKNKQHVRTPQKLLNMRTLFSTFYINVSLALPQRVPISSSLFAEIPLPPPIAVRGIAPAAEGWLHPSNLSLNFAALGSLQTPPRLFKYKCTEILQISWMFSKLLHRITGNPRDIVVLCLIAKFVE